MNAALEAKLWAFVKCNDYPPNVRAFIDAMVEAGDIKAHKQAHATLEKWTVQGCYEYGVALDLGWAHWNGKQPHARWDATPGATVPITAAVVP